MKSNQIKRFAALLEKTQLEFAAMLVQVKHTHERGVQFTSFMKTEDGKRVHKYLTLNETKIVDGAQHCLTDLVMDMEISIDDIRRAFNEAKATAKDTRQYLIKGVKALDKAQTRMLASDTKIDKMIDADDKAAAKTSRK